MRTVLDASAAVDLVARIRNAPLIRTQLAGNQLLAPAHFDAEALNALRRLELAGAIDRRRRDRAIQNLMTMPVTRLPLLPLLGGAAELLDNLTGLDALSVACVKATGADRLLTTDRRLAGAPNLGIAVTVL